MVVETHPRYLREGSGPRNLDSDLKSLTTKSAVIGGGEQVASGAELRSNDSVHLDKALGVSGRFEASHPPLALTGWLMRVLGSRVATRP
jgi:hypothetical protein